MLQMLLDSACLGTSFSVNTVKRTLSIEHIKSVSPVCVERTYNRPWRNLRRQSAKSRSGSCFSRPLDRCGQGQYCVPLITSPREEMHPPGSLQLCGEQQPTPLLLPPAFVSTRCQLNMLERRVRQLAGMKDFSQVRRRNTNYVCVF